MKKILGLVALATLSAGASAQVTLYDSIPATVSNTFNPGSATLIGANTITRMAMDDITMLGGQAGQNITTLSYTITNLNTVSVAVRMRLRFWRSDGVGGAPGTYYASPGNIGYSVTLPAMAASSATTWNIGIGAGFQVPANGELIWAGLAFDNNSGATGATATQLNNFGWAVNSPTVGTSQDAFFWTTNPGDYFTANNPLGAINNFGGTPRGDFAFRVVAAPEPTSMFAIGAAITAVIARRRRKA